MATLTFHGAARQVTGSCYLLETAHSRVLIECGLFQGPPEVDRLNERPFPFKPCDIHAVVLSHAHIDHSGLLPRLKREGFDGKVYATTQALELLDIMLKDAAHIQEKDTEWENRRRERSGKLIAPLCHGMRDVLTLGSLVYGQKTVQDIEICLRDAGISAQRSSSCGSIATATKIVFSGDLGNAATVCATESCTRRCCCSNPPRRPRPLPERSKSPTSSRRPSATAATC
jgi:metallo-beta-lactamase family protein